MEESRKQFREKGNKFGKTDFCNGNGSFGYQTEVKASMIDSAASLEAGRSNTYTGRGSYSYNFNAGNLFNQSI